MAAVIEALFDPAAPHEIRDAVKSRLTKSVLVEEVVVERMAEHRAQLQERVEELLQERNDKIAELQAQLESKEVEVQETEGMPKGGNSPWFRTVIRDEVRAILDQEMNNRAPGHTQPTPSRSPGDYQAPVGGRPLVNWT
jgi:hypothetical protein